MDDVEDEIIEWKKSGDISLHVDDVGGDGEDDGKENVIDGGASDCFSAHQNEHSEVAIDRVKPYTEEVLPECREESSHIASVNTSNVRNTMATISSNNHVPKKHSLETESQDADSLEGYDFGNKSVESLLYHSADSAQFHSADDDQLDVDLKDNMNDIFNLGVQISLNNKNITPEDFVNDVSSSSETNHEMNNKTAAQSSDINLNGNVSDPAVTVTTTCETLLKENGIKTREVSELSSEESDAVVMKTFMISSDEYDATVTTMLEISPTPVITVSNSSCENPHDDNSVVKTFEISSPRYNATITTTVEELTNPETNGKSIDILSQNYPDVKSSSDSENGKDEITFQIASCDRNSASISPRDHIDGKHHHEGNMGVISIETDDDYLKTTETLDTDISMVISISPGSSIRKSYDELSYDSSVKPSKEVESDSANDETVGEHNITIQRASEPANPLKPPGSSGDTTFEDIDTSEVSSSEIDSSVDVISDSKLPEIVTEPDSPKILSTSLGTVSSLRKSFEDLSGDSFLYNSNQISSENKNLVDNQPDEEPCTIQDTYDVLSEPADIKTRKVDVSEPAVVSATSDESVIVDNNEPVEEPCTIQDTYDVLSEPTNTKAYETDANATEATGSSDDPDTTLVVEPCTIQDTYDVLSEPTDITSKTISVPAISDTPDDTHTKSYDMLSQKDDVTSPSTDNCEISAGISAEPMQQSSGESEHAMEDTSSFETDVTVQNVYSVLAEPADIDSIVDVMFGADSEASSQVENTIGSVSSSDGDGATEILCGYSEVESNEYPATDKQMDKGVATQISDSNRSYEVLSFEHDNEGDPKAGIDETAHDDKQDVKMADESDDDNSFEIGESIHKICYFSEHEADAIMEKTFEDLSTEAGKNVLKVSVSPVEADTSERTYDILSVDAIVSNGIAGDVSENLTVDANENIRKISDFSEHEADTIIHKTFEDLSNEAGNNMNNEIVSSSDESEKAFDVLSIDTKIPDKIFIPVGVNNGDENFDHLTLGEDGNVTQMPDHGVATVDDVGGTDNQSIESLPEAVDVSVEEIISEVIVKSYEATASVIEVDTPNVTQHTPNVTQHTPNVTQLPPVESTTTSEVTYHILSFDNGPSNKDDINTVVNVIDNDNDEIFEHVSDVKATVDNTLDDEVTDPYIDVTNSSSVVKTPEKVNTTDDAFEHLTKNDIGSANEVFTHVSDVKVNEAVHVVSDVLINEPVSSSKDNASDGKTYEILSLENSASVEDSTSTLEGNLTTLEGNLTTLEGNLTTLEGNLTTVNKLSDETNECKSETFEHVPSEDSVTDTTVQDNTQVNNADTFHITHKTVEKTKDDDEFINIHSVHNNETQNENVAVEGEPGSVDSLAEDCSVVENTTVEPKVKTLAEIADVFDKGNTLEGNVMKDNSDMHTNLRSYVIDEGINYQRETSMFEVIEGVASDTPNSGHVDTDVHDNRTDPVVNGAAEHNGDTICDNIENTHLKHEQVTPISVEKPSDNSVLTNGHHGAEHINGFDVHPTSVEVKQLPSSEESIVGEVEMNAKSENKRIHSASSLDDYDVIEHDEITSAVIPESHVKRRSTFAELSLRIKKAFSPTEQKGESEDLQKVGSKKNQNVCVHTEETSNGEVVQVLTFSRNPVRYKPNSGHHGRPLSHGGDKALVSKGDTPDGAEPDLIKNGLNADVIEDSIINDGGVKKRVMMYENSEPVEDKETFTTAFGSSVIKELKEKMQVNNVEPPPRRSVVSIAPLSNIGKNLVLATPTELKLTNFKLTMDRNTLLTDRYPTGLPDYPSDRRSCIIMEIYTTERSYVRGLEIASKVFKVKMADSNLLDTKELYDVFSNIEEIMAVNANLLHHIFERISSWSDQQCIGDVFFMLEEDFDKYVTYCTNYDRGEEVIRQKKKRKDFDAVLQECYKNSKCMPGNTLSSYLITIIQRPPRYILLLKDLIKRTDDSHPDYKNLEDALALLERKTLDLNAKLKISQGKKALEALETQILGLKDYYTHDRTLVHEGPVCLLTTQKTYKCVLFNDIILFAQKGENKQSVVELVLLLETVWVEDLQTLDPQSTKGDSIALFTPDRPYRMYVGTVGEKKIWMQNLKSALSAITKQKNTYNSHIRNATFMYKDGNVYVGDFHSTKRQGHGKLTIPNVMTYEGEWADDEKNGFGVAKYYTGEVYEGDWKDDKPDGLGTFKYASGDEISCAWKDGEKNGACVITYKNHDKFTGECVNDQIEGHGELVCSNGFTYVGSWLKSMKHGKGRLKTPDNLEYNGYFVRDKFHGNGELVYPDGSYYNGEFEHGARLGNGSFTDVNGDTYDGKWVDDKKNGRGKMTYANGDVYIGNWMMDNRHGKGGTLTYAHGGSYRGNWEYDLIQGSGCMQLLDGSVYDGEFLAGMRSGYGTMKYKDGSMYKGDWKCSLYNGRGILTRPSGWVCDGTWSNGKQSGSCSLKDPANQYEFVGDWTNGIREGSGLEKRLGYTYTGVFLNDLYHGRGTETCPERSKYEGGWYNGVKHGKGVLTHANNYSEHQTWKHGALVDSPMTYIPRERTPLQRWLHT